ncbi:MAG: polyprenol monophosphomannose synthase [Elusimicrobiota bacterium]
MKILLIIPTYNEAANVDILIPGVLKYDLDVMIIDDNSPDGTAEKITSAYKNEPRIKLMRRAVKSGLGSAYRDGFDFALENGYTDVIMMDADLSHPPEKIKELIDSNADFAIGSRYVSGGGISGWPWYRLLLSYAANKFAGFMLGIPVADITAGFNRIRAGVLGSTGYNKFKTEGYGFLIELKYRAWQKGFSFGEIPIVFSDRKNGSSKLGHSIILEAFWLVLRLSLKI